MALRKQLTLVDIFCFATGAMISSGLFILPGMAFAKAGPAVFVSYLLAGLLAVAGMLSIGELATAMPKAGGEYFFISRSMGPGAGTVAGLLTWFSLSLKSAWALAGMSAFTVLVLNADLRAVSFILCLLFLVINILGAKESGRFQVMLVGVLLTLMFIYLVFGMRAVEVERFVPFAPYGLRPVFSTAGFVFVSYGGLLKIVSVSEEVKEYRKIPLGLIMACLVVTLLYVFMVFVTVGVLDPETLSGSLTPISNGAGAFMGRTGVILLGLAAMAAFLSTANAGILASSRYLLALSRDQLLPAFLGRVNRRFGTPHIAIGVTGLFMLLALTLELELLVKAASTVLILPFILVNIAVIILRESRLQSYRPTFRAPLYPWVQIAGIVGCGILLLSMGREALTISFMLIGTGVLIYLLYGRLRARHEHALLHVIERLTSLDLSSGMLESELKEIIREKDDIYLDRFDHILEKCVVIDADRPLGPEEFFELASRTLAEKHRLNAGALVGEFLRRENESSTVISPGVAIPHVIIEGNNLFDLVLVRCLPGITMIPGEPPVKAAFVLVGSRDARNFHLRALSAIAQIIQNRDFNRRWINARGAEELRDIILLAERIRFQGRHP